MKRSLFVASVVFLIVTIVLLALVGPASAYGPGGIGFSRGGFGHRGGGGYGGFGYGGFSYGGLSYGYSQPLYVLSSPLLVQPLYAPQQLLVQPIYTQPVLAPVGVAPVYAPPLALSAIQTQVLAEVQVYAPFASSYQHLGAYCQTPHFQGLPLELRNRVGQHFPGIHRGRR